MRLIDSDALLKKFDDTGIQITFDLPVEEILGEGVDIDDFSMLVQDAIRAYRKMVIETIKEHPTAYSVEAVVAAIKTKHCKKCRNIWQSKDGDKYCKDIKCEIEEVCEIIRNGGKDSLRGCGNCKHQPEPLTTCDWMKSQTVVFKECPRWERKEQP